MHACVLHKIGCFAPSLFHFVLRMKVILLLQQFAIIKWFPAYRYADLWAFRFGTFFCIQWKHLENCNHESNIKAIINSGSCGINKLSVTAKTCWIVRDQLEDLLDHKASKHGTCSFLFNFVSSNCAWRQRHRNLKKTSQCRSNYMHRRLLHSSQVLPSVACLLCSAYCLICCGRITRPNKPIDE